MERGLFVMVQFLLLGDARLPPSALLQSSHPSGERVALLFAQRPAAVPRLLGRRALRSMPARRAVGQRPRLGQVGAGPAVAVALTLGHELRPLFQRANARLNRSI